MTTTTDQTAAPSRLILADSPDTVPVNTVAQARVQAVRSAVAQGTGKSGRGFRKLLATETKVWLRSSDVFWTAFPALLLVVAGLLNEENRMPLQGGPDHMAYGTPLYGVYALNAVVPAFIAMAIGMACICVLPSTFGAFREKGMIKRFSATPMSPYGLFAAHYIIVIVMSLAGAALAVGTVAVLVPLYIPQNIIIVLAGIIIGLLSMLALGSIISALVKTTKSGQMWGNLVFFPLMFVAGVFTPVLPGSLIYNIGRFTPMGAASQVLWYGWFGGNEGMPWLQLAVMVVWTAVLVPAAVKLFRW